MTTRNQDPSIYTKRQLISWLNDLLCIQVHSIEQLGNGAAFCQLADIITNGGVRMQKVNWNAKLQHENLSNLKTLSTAMLGAGIDKQFDVIRIAQKKTQDILELLQWFRKYFVTNRVRVQVCLTPVQNYNAANRRRPVSTEKNLNDTRLTVEANMNIPSNLANSNKPKVFAYQRPEQSGKKQIMEDPISDIELKNCFKINKEIRKIIKEQTNTSAEAKLQLIQNILFNKKTPKIEQPRQTQPHPQSHPQSHPQPQPQPQPFQPTQPSSSSNYKTIPDHEKPNSHSITMVKFEENLVDNSPLLGHNFRTGAGKNSKNNTFQVLDALDIQIFPSEKKTMRSEKLGK